MRSADSIRNFDAALTARALNFEALIPALESMLLVGCEVPLRQTYEINGSTTILIMPAWQSDGCLGVKTVTVVPSNCERGLPGLFSTYQLFDARSGVVLANIDGNEITSRRTAAASALAASRLAAPNARTLLLVGTGRVGSLLPAAYRIVRPIGRVLVWDRYDEVAVSFARKLRGQGIEVEAVDNLKLACAEADIVCCATPSTVPLIQGAWLRPGNHLDLIGSFKPEMRESDDACFAQAEVWIDTEEALTKTGDLLSPIKSGTISRSDVRGTLADPCHQPIQARDPGARTVFKAVGTGLADLAAAMLVLRSQISDEPWPNRPYAN